MPARDRRILLAAAVATSASLLVAAIAGHAEVLAYAAPLFLLAVPLLAGRFVEVGLDDDDGAPVWLVIVALALGALGLLAGGAALAQRGRRP